MITSYIHASRWAQNKKGSLVVFLSQRCLFKNVFALCAHLPPSVSLIRSVCFLIRFAIKNCNRKSNNLSGATHSFMGHSWTPKGNSNQQVRFLQSGKDGRGTQKIFFIVHKGAQKKRVGAHNNPRWNACIACAPDHLRRNWLAPGCANISKLILRQHTPVQFPNQISKIIARAFRHPCLWTSNKYKDIHFGGKPLVIPPYHIWKSPYFFP